jgi:hypothetical protein
MAEIPIGHKDIYMAKSSQAPWHIALISPSAQSQIGFVLVFLGGCEWPAHRACLARFNLRPLKKIAFIFFAWSWELW